jgi:hypothetical protein
VVSVAEDVGPELEQPHAIVEPHELEPLQA